MSNNQLQDERVLTIRRKIQSETYALVITALLGSVLVQQFLLRAPFAQYAVEFFVVIGCGAYTTIRNLSAGIDLWGTGGAKTGKKRLLSTVLGSLCAVLLLAVLSGQTDATSLGVFFVCFVVASLLLSSGMAALQRRKQHAIERALDADEMKE